MGLRTFTYRCLFFICWAACSVLLYGCGAPAVMIGLRAEYPEQRFILFIDPIPAAFVLVDSLQPTLRWESFPRVEDIENKIGTVADVSYQLRISGDGFNYNYSRDGVKEPCHKIETPLEPSKNYLWTVRACFVLNGENRCTVWGAVSKWEYWTFPHPNVWSYRFQAPPK